MRPVEALLQPSQRTIDPSKFSSALHLYNGIVENMSFSSGLGTFILEISPQIFSSQKNSFSAKMNNIATIDFDPDGRIASEDYILRIEQSVPFPTWRWAKFGDVALKLRPPRDPGNFAASNRGSELIPGKPGVFRFRQLVALMCR